MKLDPILVRKEREVRAWSQEHLAEVSGLSLRTIQRVESDGSASPETRLSLAAAFGVDLVLLSRPAAPSTEPQAVAGETAHRPALQRPRKDPIWTALRLVAVGCAVVLYELTTKGRISWSLWPLVGLGIGAAGILLRDKIRLIWSWGAIASALVVLDMVQSGRPTWSIWVVLGWVLGVVYPWLRRREQDRKV